MSSTPADFNAEIVEEFRAHGGKVGGVFEGAPLLLLHHTGAKSGVRRVTPLMYLREGDGYAVFASKAGAPENPAWYHNLKANPATSIEVGSQTLDVVAREATGEERDRLFTSQAGSRPQFGEYQKKTERTIPVMVLSPAR